jgi:hypothetical protein
VGQIEHFVLTRFNLPTKGKEARLRSRSGWLEHRFELFETFCLPSCISQTDPTFKWLVFCDIDTPKKYADRICGYAKSSQLIPAFVNIHESDFVRREIRKHLKPDCESLLTTRLDNDDGLHSRFVERVKAEARRLGNGFYNCEHGLIYRNGRLYESKQESNSFISRLEHANDFKTVWEMQHHLIGASHNVHPVELPMAWVQVVHRVNVANIVRGRLLDIQDWPDGYASLSQVTLRPVSALKIALDRILLERFRYP